MSVPHHAIGSDVWPGTAKLAEESSELGQVLGKLVAYPHARLHPDGTNLRERLMSEMADVLAAVDFVMEVNSLPWKHVNRMREVKLARFRGWHEVEARHHHECSVGDCVCGGPLNEEQR